MTLLSEEYQLNLLSLLATKHTGDYIQVTKHSDYYEKLWNITRNKAFIARGVTFDQARRLLIPLVPPELVKDTPKSPRKKKK